MRRLWSADELGEFWTVVCVKLCKSGFHVASEFMVRLKWGRFFVL